MLKSTQYTIESSNNQLNNKLILNPLQLLVSQLQSKDINIRKKSIQQIQVIGLCMDEKQIISQLLPLLMKTLIQQNSKQIKILIVKSLNNILNLLTRQQSYLRLVQLLFDMIIVFDQQDIKQQAFNVLDNMLFKDNLLNFKLFKQTIFNLALHQLLPISQSNNSTNSKNMKQLVLFLIKYLLSKHKQLQQNQINQIYQLIDNKFLLLNLNNQIDDKKNIDYRNLKIFSQYFHLLIQSWPSQYQDKLQSIINCLMGININQTKQSKQINQQNNQQVIKQQNQQPQQKVSNQSIPNDILQQVKSNLVQLIIIYGQKYNLKKAYNLLSILLKQQSIKIKISIIKKTKSIFDLFNSTNKQDEYNLQDLIKIFKQFNSQSQQVKKIILQVMNQIQLPNQQKQQYIIKNSKNITQLKNILIQSLIKSNKSQQISKILSQSDYDFKIKIFLKLNDNLLHNNHMYKEIIDSLLSDNKKNFRSKLNLILNLINRIQDNVVKMGLNKNSNNKNDLSKNKQIINRQTKLGQSYNISYLISMLIKYNSDRIAIIRVNIAKLIALMLYWYDIDFNTIKGQLQNSLHGQNKSWFQRQNILIIIQQYLSIHSKFTNNKTGEQQMLSSYRQKQQANQLYINQQLKDKNLATYQFIIHTLKTTLSNSYYSSTNKNDNKTKQIKNITQLAFSIINNYSILI